jgi:hypothetical protein
VCVAVHNLECNRKLKYNIIEYVVLVPKVVRKKLITISLINNPTLKTLNIIIGTFTNSSVNIVTGYGLGGRGFFPVMGKIFFSGSQRQDQLWIPTSILSNE